VATLALNTRFCNSGRIGIQRVGTFKRVSFLGVRIRRIRKFLGLPDPDPLVRAADPDLNSDPDPFIIKQK
jgi:hypothetical protein